ncbi:MAG: DEAD/DEAH box helicase, partial [Hadesarchaea archaeon]|nr:DEAD/DEAH box helicase [Hadesarchaea archaeon]
MQHPLIKPNSIEARTYQQVILGTAIKGNTLVVLPTGMGKTQIAIMVAAHRLASVEGSKVLMMAPTRPLAVQHRQSFSRFMTLPERELQVLTGETPPARRQELWRSSTLIFATPQVVEHDLLAGRLSLEGFSLLIFDEAHRAVGDYPYAFIAERYVREAKDPLILALTASPGADAARIEEVKRNLFIGHVETRTERDIDVRPYVKPIEIEWRRLELPKEFVEVKQMLEGPFKEQLALLKAHGFIADTRGVGKRDLLEVQAKIQAAMHGLERPPERFYAALLAQAVAIRLCHAIELLETQGLVALERYLARLLRRAHMPGATKALKVLANDPRTWKAFRLVQRLREQVEHPKLEEAAKVLKAQFEREPSSRAIVFAHYRDSVDRLFEALSKLPGVRPVKFIGQAARGADVGMSQKEQAQILEAFRAGEYNVLISTSVGEEGLDIPSV